ncbi:MAG: CPBP family intramembrane metalloprotease [Anaerolineae bacterium]|nr:CPBP family intramembrane metalloprotease [Anaerolineae bacterium]
MKAWFDARPLAGSLIIWVADIVFVLGGAALLSVLFPAMPGYGRGLSQSLVLVLIGVLLIAALLTALGWWRRAGFVGPSEWRDLRVLWLPTLALLLPFVAGIQPLPANELLTLIVGYAATAFFEEAIYRGAIVGLLRPKGIWTAVLVSSLLFGLVHLSNIALRGNPGLIALQALGAATGGVGMAAIRVRTRTVWPGIGLHALHDLFFQMSRLPVPLVDAANSIILLLYAVYLLRPSVRARLEAELGEPATAGMGVTV